MFVSSTNPYFAFFRWVEIHSESVRESLFCKTSMVYGSHNKHVLCTTFEIQTCNKSLELATIFRKLKAMAPCLKRSYHPFLFVLVSCSQAIHVLFIVKKEKKEFGALPFRLYSAMKFAVREQLAGGSSTVHVVGYFSYHGGETLITFNSSTCFRKQS